MKSPVKSLSVAVGAAFISSLAGAGVATATENPFGMTQLSSGYMVADNHEGKCGEGKCGGNKNQASAEGKGAVDEAHENNADSDMNKTKAEGKCGEGKCGGAK